MHARTPVATAAKLTVILVLGLLATLLGPVVAHHFPAPPPTTTPTTFHQPQPSAPRSAAGSVVLRHGDTLWSLARRHGTTVAALQRTNHLGRSTLIYAGHRLRLPAKSTTPHPEETDAAVGGTRDADASSTRAAERGRAAVAFAQSLLGTPYLWGGTGRGGYDCSGLVQAAWRSAGVRLPRTTYTQIHAGTQVRRAELRPGDLVFTHRLGHVQLYAGGGRILEATRPVVRHAPLPSAESVTAYVRPTG